MENSPEDFDLLYKRSVDKVPTVIDVGFFACGNISFMSTDRVAGRDAGLVPDDGLRDGGRTSGTEREAVQRFYDYMCEKLVHGTGDHNDFANLFRPYTVPPLPHFPELGWIAHVGEAGNPSSSVVITGAFHWRRG